MALPAEMEENLTEMEATLSTLEKELEPLLSTPWEQLTSKLEPMEKAKLNLMIAYVANSLFYVFLKTQGKSTADHPVTDELARIKDYMGNLKELGPGAAKKPLKLDKEAAERFINASIGGAAGGSKKHPKPSGDDSGKKVKKKKASS